MNENTFHGTVGREIRINHSQRTGNAVVNFSIAINSRRRDQASGQWVDRPTVWKDVVVFGLLAANVYDTLATGMHVVVTGEEVDDSFTKESREPGGEDTVIRRTKIEAREVAVSLRFQTATVEKVQRNREQSTEQRSTSSTAPQPVG
ncbi:single-stranded DNA-binding protein [Pseudonocardia sp. WMMC193]|uniref:single-stranded DNA-binding protein n=1 Tax=Pseudonocardia sp. WMMC193 TaxID=2911965 RepID=UPI001F028715|nr:single-stranded DNA-binding protein [Pseudonocardia sp. WMMC193]MCF7547324.1 single-stranded DNA-binding protein [Pseudonocardia sp. WMMC193]